MLKLLIQDDEGRKKLVPFQRNEITIGRGESNTIQLTERNVSRNHARLFRHSTQIFIEDLRSHNGILVNGQRVQGQAVIHKGDTIVIGDYDIVLDGTVPPLSPTPPLPSPALRHPNDNVIPFSSFFPEKNTEPNFDADDELEYPSEAAPPPPPVQGTELDEYVHDVAPLPVTDVVASISSVDTLDLSPTPKERPSPPPAKTFDLPPVERPTIRLPEFVELSEDESPRLVALNLDLRGREFLCSRNEFSLGRSQINELVLNHNSVAPLHCRVERDENNNWYLALNPQHPVLVNGEPYQQLPLENGDVLTLGKQELQFFLPSPPLAQKISPHTPSPSKKPQPKTPSKFLPFGIGLILSFFIVAAGLSYFYWKIGALHESPWLALNAFAHQYLPLPPHLQPPPQNQPPPPATAPDIPLPPPSNEKPSEPLADPPPPSTEKTETSHLKDALQPSAKTQDPNPSSKLNKALEKPGGKPAHKPAAPTATELLAPNPSITPPRNTTHPSPAVTESTTVATTSAAVMPAATRAPTKKTSRANKITEATPEKNADPETPSLLIDDAEDRFWISFWDEVDELQKQADREVSTASKIAAWSARHKKLVSCELARCVYERARTSLILSNMKDTPATTRYPREFETYLSMKDKEPHSRTRKEDACKILRDYYARENTFNQKISEICTTR